MQLVEVLGDHDDAGALGAPLEQQLLRAARRRDVEAPARVGGDQHAAASVRERARRA